jgi:two-component system, OmpR family, response regulator
MQSHPRPADAPAPSPQSMQKQQAKPLILVVEDEAALVTLLRYNLEREGFEVIEARDGEEALLLAKERRPDLVLLDWMLPLVSGIEVCRQLRRLPETRAVPVVMLTARGEEADKVRGLDSGADDYVTKPFSPRELLARVRAVLRRDKARRAAAPRDLERGRSRFGGWQLDRRSRRLTDPSGNPVALTKGEYALLIAFLDAPQRPLTREYLLQATRVHEDVSDRSIDVQVLRLRRKLVTDPSAPSIIQTERGVGYIFTLSVESL